MGDGSGTMPGEVMHHIRVESERGTEQHQASLDLADIDLENLTALDRVKKMVRIGDHPVITGEEILRTGWIVVERNAGMHGRRSEHSNRAIATDRDEQIHLIQLGKQPFFKGPHLRFNEGDLDPTSVRKRLAVYVLADGTGGGTGTALSGDGIECDEHLHLVSLYHQVMNHLQWIKKTTVIASLLVAAGMITGRVDAQTQEFELGQDDRWESTSTEEASLQKRQLLSARRAILEGNPQRGKDLASAFIDRYPNAPTRAEAYLIRGDALLAMGDEYEALFEYEEIARNYPNSPAFVTALEREFEIAQEYANGRYRKLLTLFRIVPATDEAQELLIRIQERLPGSRLAEQAGMALADYYFRVRDLRMAAEAYDLFLENYPRSKDVNKARLRLIYSYLADYRGPKYDSTGLQEARLRLEDLRANEPGLAQRIGAESLLVRIYESDASKLLTTAQYYLSVADPISAEYTIRALITRYPNSIASLEALRGIPDILAKLPETVVKMGPDYRALRQEKLGIAWNEDTDLTGVADTPVPTLPTISETTGETILPTRPNQTESSENQS